MKRVKFVKSKGRNVRGTVVTLHDEEADRAIAAGDAVAGEPVQSVGGTPPRGEPHQRVIFLKPWQQWPKDARALVPETVAFAAVKAGAAKLFPIPSVGSGEDLLPKGFTR